MQFVPSIKKSFKTVKGIIGFEVIKHLASVDKAR